MPNLKALRAAGKVAVWEPRSGYYHRLNLTLKDGKASSWTVLVCTPYSDLFFMSKGNTAADHGFCGKNPGDD